MAAPPLSLSPVLTPHLVLGVRSGGTQ
jgi:hypothetical protein